MNAKILLKSLAAVALGTAGSAWAHPGHGDDVGGFVAGLAHPVFGADHLLAMLAIGLWAARLGGRALWALPSTFMAAMSAGAVLAFAGLAVPFVEPLVAASVLVLGLMLTSSASVSKAAPYALAAAFAVFHGLAHGTEIPAESGRIGYLSGFMLSTGAIHIVGIALAHLLGNSLKRHRAAGVPIALAGAWLLAGAM